MQVRALITGFAPYGHRGCNPAAEVALAMDGKIVAGAQVIGRTLPVAYSSLRSEIEALLAEIQPAVAIGLGLWPGEPVIRIERIGVNVTDFEIPDNEGKLLVDEVIQADGLAARLSTLPIRKIEQALLDAGIPARISSTAGTFLCNACVYTLLGAADAAENAQVGREPSEHPDCPADKTRTQLGGPPVELTDRRNGSEQQVIIDNRRKPGDRPKDKVERPRCGTPA
jgi:pyroglutamyl-peptidase